MIETTIELEFCSSFGCHYPEFTVEIDAVHRDNGIGYYEYGSQKCYDSKIELEIDEIKVLDKRGNDIYDKLTESMRDYVDAHCYKYAEDYDPREGDYE